MKKIIALTGILILTVLSYATVVAAPKPSPVTVENATSQPVPITAPQPLNVSIFHQPFVLFDSGVVSGPLDLEVATSGCNTLLACVYNYSVGATNLPVTLSLDFVYPALVPPSCTGSGLAAVSLLKLTVNSLSSSCANFTYNVIPACLRVTTTTEGQATSYSVILVCQ